MRDCPKVKVNTPLNNPTQSTNGRGQKDTRACENGAGSQGIPDFKQAETDTITPAVADKSEGIPASRPPRKSMTVYIFHRGGVAIGTPHAMIPIRFPPPGSGAFR